MTSTAPEPAYRSPTYHSRHIPRAHLDLTTEVGREVQANGLCDTCEPEMLQRLADLGVSVIETRLVWWEMEPRPGLYDFSRLERDLDRIESAGLKGAVFPWFQHPPTWYDPDGVQHLRFRCLEHDQASTVLSLWDEKTLEVHDRLYGELARRLGDRLSFLYAGITADFGEVCYLAGVNHYRFSPPHNHSGFWCGDRLARQAFAQRLIEKYGDVTALNQAWGTQFADWDEDFMPALPFSGNPLPRRCDFAMWYIDALLSFSDDACSIVRRHFPKTEIGIPLGFPDETLAVGQIKSRAVKIASRHNMLARWTGMAHLGSFARSNIMAKRFSSAAHFYETSFGTEAALTLDRSNVPNGLYESLANGAEIIHDDPQNMLRAREAHVSLKPKLFASRPINTAAVLYPLLDELLEINFFDLTMFLDSAAALRQNLDYEVCDHEMIEDGFLQNVSDLIVLCPVHLPETTIAALGSFVTGGGRVWLSQRGCLRQIDVAGQTREIAGPTAGTPADTHDIAVHRFAEADELPTASAYADLATRHGPGYYTIHEDFVSRYQPQEQLIEILPKCDA